MKLVLIGGAGFRVPQVVAALAASGPVDEVVLTDTNADRLHTMAGVVAALPGIESITVSATTDVAAALPGAQFVFCAIRVGGELGRVSDERVALDHGVLGQETTGPGGLAYALRTIPVMRAIARTVRDIAPQAWFVNFTNPAGIITEALRPILGDRIVGICDSPIALVRRALDAIGADDADYDYVGLNHLGWLRSLVVDGEDKLPGLLASADVARIEEVQLIGVDWVRQLGALPNEYLFYYYRNREAVARLREAKYTRGEYIEAQQDAFYAAAAHAPRDLTLDLWRAVKMEREQTYMAEARADDESRNPESAGGGYQGVAVSLIGALSGGPATSQIVNVANQGVIPGLPADAVVEVRCTVDASGVRPLPVSPVPDHMLGLMQCVKAAERLVIRAAVERSDALAWAALATHPLVDSVHVARQILDGYRARIPEVDAVLSGR
jgi:6-phospho-beta-glucosidase